MSSFTSNLILNFLKHAKPGDVLVTSFAHPSATFIVAFIQFFLTTTKSKEKKLALVTQNEVAVSNLVNDSVTKNVTWWAELPSDEKTYADVDVVFVDHDVLLLSSHDAHRNAHRNAVVVCVVDV